MSSVTLAQRVVANITKSGHRRMKSRANARKYNRWQQTLKVWEYELLVEAEEILCRELLHTPCPIAIEIAARVFQDPEMERVVLDHDIVREIAILVHSSVKDNANQTG